MLFLILSPSLFSSPSPSVPASPPTILSVVVLLSPSPPHWAGLGDAEGLSLSVFALCLPASHWLSSSRGFLSLHISLSPFPSLCPPALHCAASYPRSFFLPLPLTALTPFLYFSHPISLFSLLLSTLIWEPLIVLSLQLPLFSSSFCHSFSSPYPHLPFARESSWTSIKTLVLLIPH